MKQVVISLLAFSLFALSAGCAAEAGGPEGAAPAEEDLTSVPTGHYAIDREPSSGNYVSRLTISTGKKIELEYVRRTTTYESWFMNPFFRIPVTKSEAVVLRGTYMLFEGDRGTMISFDVTDGSVDHLIYAITKTREGLTLEAIGGRPFDLHAGPEQTTPTVTRVLRCSARRWDAVLTLDRDQRRGGTMKITRHADAERSDPPNVSFSVDYTGNTGVDDYMRYEGVDRRGNGYDFALKKSDLERTAGPTANVGLGYTPDLAPGAYHNSLSCTIATR